jgi:T5SS/PEP-CTERM-associated repeat protein
MRKPVTQAVVLCIVLAVTMCVANANYSANNYPVDLVINAASPQPWASSAWVYMGSANRVNGAGAWDGTIIVESNGVVTSDRIWVGSGSSTTSGRLIVDGGTWTATSVLHLGIRGPDGLGDDEVNVVEIKNGGMLSINGLEMADNGYGRLIVDNATLNNVGAGWIGGAGAGDAEVTIRNGGTGDSGFTALNADGSGHSTLNVDGVGSLWNGHSFYLGGNARTSSLNITGGGTVLADNFYCSQGTAPCDVTISGAGSLLDATHDVFIGQVGPAIVSIEEGGNIEADGNVTVYNNGTLVFGLGHHARLHSTSLVTLNDGATIAITLDGGFVPLSGVPYNLITTTSASVIADPANLVLDLSAVAAEATGFLGLNPAGSALQLTFIDIEPPPLFSHVEMVSTAFLEFNSPPGVSFDLEASTDGTNYGFTGLTLIGNGDTMRAFDPAGFSTQKQYRLSLRPPPNQGPLVIDADSHIVIVVSDTFGTARPLMRDLIEKYVLGALGKSSLAGTGKTVNIVVEADAATWYELSSSELQDIAEIDAFEIVTTDEAEDWIRISGKTAMGAGFGVMHLLENFLGITWMFPGDLGMSYAPAQTFSIPVMSIGVSPSVASRTHTGYEHGDPAYAVYGSIGLVNEERYFFAAYDALKVAGWHQLIHASHNMINIFPVAEVLANYPEVFPKYADGSTYVPPLDSLDFGHQEWHPDYTEPKTLEVTIEKALAAFTNDNVHTFSLGINDGGLFRCQCPDCVAAGWPNAYYDYVNAVAQAVQAHSPPHLIGVLAYGDVSLPYPGLQLESNVIVLATGGVDKHETWKNHAHHQGTYEYFFGRGFWVPNVPLAAMKSNSVYYARKGISHYHSEDHHLWAFDGPKHYIQNHLLWDPDYDVEAGLQRYCEAAVGADAAPDLLLYYELLASLREEDVVENGVSPLWPWDWPYFPWRDSSMQFSGVDTAFYAAALGFLQDAAAQVPAASDQEARLEMVRRFFDYSLIGFTMHELVRDAHDMGTVTDWTDTFSGAQQLQVDRQSCLDDMNNHPEWFTGSELGVDEILSSEWEGNPSWKILRELDDAMAMAAYRINATAESLGGLILPPEYTRYLEPFALNSPVSIVLETANAWYPDAEYVPMTRNRAGDVITFSTTPTTATFEAIDLPPWVDTHKGHWFAIHFTDTIDAAATRLWSLNLDAAAKEGRLFVQAYFHSNGENYYNLLEVHEESSTSLTGLGKHIVIQPRFYNSTTDTWSTTSSTAQTAGLYVQVIWKPESDTSSISGTLTVKDIDFTAP